MENIEQPFYQLPEALVEEMLLKSQKIGDFLLQSLTEVSKKKEIYRNELFNTGLLKRDADLPHISPPTTCGIDGSYVVERLMATDLVAVAAVAIEGLTPPSEKREWGKPYHKVFISSVSHNPDTTVVVRGIMWEMELILAAEAPHDIVFLDGSITNPFLNLNTAISKFEDFRNNEVGKTLAENFEKFLDSYLKIVCSNRTDKLWVGLPKYTSKREIGKKFNWPTNFDDRAMLTSLLKAGEYITPIKYEQPNEKWHIGMEGLTTYYKSEFDKKLEQIVNSINNLHVCYYKPHPYTPALRIEVPQSICTNKYQLATLLNAINFQCGTPGILEPYPLFMSDRMVKNLSKAIPAFRQTATRQIAEKYEDDLSEIFFNMNSYRTENGK
ncbi:MAG TPA: DNA double-strand break repair nuclease NurA [Bacteroidales bacterium]|nr:DNA double-strand break repair nuclease NurA [Bacteroidales bacterium]HRT78830.1 DNA double-strand break repair nuclease NurA [Paludibacteraceae bacterium]HOK73780.1 DNA double-strand break repair nuclease NurA [Bacteroidales bacterium]HOM39377.1 DNA double-strand break repair nuclease NurA [Bacteroidales bacterium]HPP91486.1 DNA double-strand break repair nuclease NurA [Bacteroidales bacterium]